MNGFLSWETIDFSLKRHPISLRNRMSGQFANLQSLISNLHLPRRISAEQPRRLLLARGADVAGADEEVLAKRVLAVADQSLDRAGIHVLAGVVVVDVGGEHDFDVEAEVGQQIYQLLPGVFAVVAAVGAVTG